MYKVRKNYKSKLIMIFAVFNLLCILVTSISFYIMSNINLNRNYSEIIKANLNETVKNVNRKTYGVEYLAKSYIIDENFYANMSRSYSPLEGNQILNSYLLPQGKNMITLSETDVVMTLYLENTTIPEHFYNEYGERSKTRIFNVMNIDRIKDKDYYVEVKKSLAYMKWRQIDDDKEKGLISLVTKVGYIFGGKDTGILIIKASLDEIVGHSVPNTNEMELYYRVTDSEGEVLISNIEGESKRLAEIFERQHISGEMDNDWNIDIYMPLSNISSGKSRILLIMLALAVVIFLANLMIGKMMSDKIYISVSDILSAIKKYRQGEYDYQISIKGDDEFAEIAEAVNALAGEIQHLIDDVYEGMIQNQNIEFQMLRAKINPHFLSNILNLIIQLSESNEQEKITEVAQKTSTFYRRILAKNRNYVKLMDERNDLESYLEIIDILKPEAVRWSYSISKAAERCIIPAFLLQPIVENSVNHSMMDSELSVELNAEVKEGNDLCITIKDNGEGMTQEQIDDLFKIKPNSGYGLYNIRSRIKLKYPEDSYGIFVTSELGQGTETVIIIPAVYENEEEELQNV